MVARFSRSQLARPFRVGGVGLWLSAALAGALGAGPQCTEDAMIVFDGSGSMSEMGFNHLDEPRIFDARRAMRQVMPDIALHRRLGLIIYGPGQGGACENIDLRFPPLPRADGPIIEAVDGLEPDGRTPLTEAVRQAAGALDPAAQSSTIVLVTDGKETCGGAPCALAAQLAAERPGLTVHVIGFKMRGDYFSWDRQDPGYTDGQSATRCLADHTGGRYVDAETLDELVAALRETLGCALFSARPSNPVR
ncbi:MAG: VWA domain-containing protein [Mangrovicoccus sp.]|nr:VWA domain-containing protein [Mangrovicoccus sp.]